MVSCLLNVRSAYWFRTHINSPSIWHVYELHDYFTRLCISWLYYKGIKRKWIHFYYSHFILFVHLFICSSVHLFNTNSLFSIVLNLTSGYRETRIARYILSHRPTWLWHVHTPTYTHAHWGHEECPIKKKGFDNVEYFLWGWCVKT